MSESVIKVQNLIKKYKKADKNAVNNISFDVKKGEFFAFLGPNGAGKTTTISVLTSTLSKTSGTVEIVGYDVEKEANKIRENVGIIFQKPSLDLKLTAEENIRLHAALYNLYPFRPAYGLMSKAYKDHILELATVLGIEKELKQPVETFSGGMKRKLEIVRSLMHSPKILFLDEPTTGLDPESRRNLWEYLEKVRAEKGTTIFLTTHYLDEVEGADRVVILSNGEIVANDSPANIKRELVDETLELHTKDSKKLVTELDKMKLNHTGSNGIIRVSIRNKSVQEIIQNIKTKIDYIDIHRPTMEEAYLNIIEQDNQDANEDQA